MARVQADTLKTRSANRAGGGRKPTNGNAARTAQATVEPETVAIDETPEPADEPEDEPEAAAPTPLSEPELEPEVAAPAPRRASAARASVAAKTGVAERDQLVALGKLLKMAIARNTPVSELAEELQAMLDAYNASLE